MEYTSLEKIVIDALVSRGVHFRTQVPTRSGFVLDFLISPNIVIESDGPCHDGSNNKRRDRFRDKILKINGYNVHRIDYRDIENGNLDEFLDGILII